MPKPLDRDRLASQCAQAEMGEGRLHPTDDAAGGWHRRVAAAAQSRGNAGREPGTGEDRGHVLDGSPDILGRDVTPLDGGDEVAVLLIDPATVSGASALGNQTLPAAPPEPGERVLERHPLGEAQPVAKEILDAGIAPEPDPARSLTAPSAVDERGLEHPGFGSELAEDPLMLVEVA